MPTQPTVEINQPEAISSDSHSPIYYTGKTKAAMSRFKGSANYLKFKQEYERAIQNIIDFYKQHVSSQGKDGIMPYKPDRITTVENMFIKFKTNLFSENSKNNLHHLYQAKKHIEEIAQSLQEERNIPTAIKVDEIRELAGKIMMCGSGAYSHIIATKLSLTAPSGELSDNFSVYKNTIAHAVITEFISRDLTDINPAEEIHLFNLYWNIFSKRLGVAAIEDKLSIILIFTTKIAACQNALQQAFTPYRLTDKLATDHWNNLHNIIGDAAEWEQINDILAGVKSSYKPINVYALTEESPDSPGKYRLRQDKTWLQVEIAKQLSLLPSQIAWIDWTPIAVEGRRLQRIGDLFWQEIDGELISPPTIEDLVKYADQMAYKQLIDGITHAKEQDAIWLSRIDPQYLQATNADDLSLFFSKLGAEKGIEYAKINLRWFNKLKFNPLITTLLTLPPEQLATLSSDLLCYINDEELISFFLKLGNERFIRYAQDNPHWLTKLIVDTPALIKMLSTMPDSEVANLDTSFLHWINLEEIKYFFAYWEANTIKPGSPLLKKLYQRTHREVIDADKFSLNNLWGLFKGSKRQIYAHIMGQLLNYSIDIAEKSLIENLLKEKHIHLKQSDHGVGDNPLVRALDKNLSWMIPELLSKHNLQAYQASYQYNLLYYPIKNKNLTALQLLLNAGADPNKYLKWEPSILQQAVLSGEPDLVALLLKHNAQDNAGDALKAAIQQGNVEMVEQLVAVARPIDLLMPLTPSLLSLARTAPNSERIIDILESQINVKQQRFDQIMSASAVREIAYIPFKPVGRVYQAILDSLERLHNTFDSEQIITAFILKAQIADYSEDYFHDERREEVFRVLDAQLDTALFTPETTETSIEIITDFAQNNLPFAIDLYQWVSSHALHASMNFLLDELKQQQDPAAYFKEIKNIYGTATHLADPLAVTQWESKYSGAARNALNRQLEQNLGENNDDPISVALRQEAQGLLFGYSDDVHYQKSLDYIQRYMPSLKKKGVTTIVLPLNEVEEQSIKSYMKSPGVMRDINKLTHVNTALKHLCIEAYLRGIKIRALMPEDNPQNTLQRVLSDDFVVTGLQEVLTQLPRNEKFIALYPQHRLLSQKLQNGFLPGIARRLGLPALAVSGHRLSLLNDPLQSASPFHSVEEMPSQYAYHIAVVDPHDTHALWAAGQWLKGDPKRRYLVGIDGAHFNLYSPNGHPADVPQEALHKFRTTLTAQPDARIQVLFVGEKSLFLPTPEDASSTEKWNGQSLVETREKISDLITQHLPGLRTENIQVILGQISVITDLDENNHPLPLRTEVTVDYLAPLRTSADNIIVDPLLPQSPHRVSPTTGLPGGQAEHSDAIKLIQLIERQTLPPPSAEVRIQPPAITSADKALLLKMATVQKKIHLQALARHVTAVIEQMTQQLNNNVEKIRYRFKKFVTTTESETALLFVQARPTAQQNQQQAPLEKRLTPDNAIFVTMRDKMTALEPEIAHVDGVSTLNVAFLAMHLLARQHEDEASAWRKFVTVANLTQILHGIGQDMGRLANCIKIVNGAGAKAEGMLGKLMGGAAYTHAGSVVNVAVDIINLIDAIEELKQMPASPQKDFATTRVVLASSQLAVDSTLTVLGATASFSPAIANGMAVAAPLSVPFVGVMIGANALVTAVASNNAHYQVELDQIIAPFRHLVSKSALQPKEILQPDPEHPQLMYFEPYVPIKKIVINGERVSVQVADIRVPQFEDKALGKHTSDYHRALSAYSAFGFDVTRPGEQAVRLHPSSILALPAALNGHYQFIHDTGAYGRLDGKAIFNQFHQYHDALFPFTIEGVNAPNNVRFHPHPTRQVIALDAGVRYITFQTIQQVNRLPGQHHDGLSAGQLPTPITDAAHAHYLTYQFEGAGGTTFIDLPDDARQIIITPSSDRLKRLSESWVLDITPDITISNREARIALQQAHIERLALHHSGEEWALTLANSTVKITHPTLENIRLQLHPIELPGVTFNLTLLGNRPAAPQFHLSLAVESIATLSDDNLSNIKSIMQRYFSDSRRFSFNPPLRLDIQLGQGNIATGLLDLTSGRWQAIHNDGSTTAHPHLYTSEGQRVALLARPNARITGVAHIEYDHAQQQFYVAGIAKPRDHLNNTLSYHYYPHLAEKARYQKIEIAHLDEENSEENGWQVRSLEPLLDEIHAQSPQAVIPLHLPTTGLRAEYAWDGERKFFKKMAWEQDEHQFIAECHDSETLPMLTVIALPSSPPAPLTVSKLGADFLSKYQNALSALTLVAQDNTPKVDLLDFPLIPLKVFAHLDTKIVGAREGTTLFLHSGAVPNITFKLTAQQRVPGESALKWGVSLYAENQQALQGESRAKIVHILQNHKNNALSWDIGLSIPLSIGDSQGGQTDGMFDVAAPLINNTAASTAKGINKTPDTALLGQAIGAFGEGNDELLSQNRRDSVLAFYAGAAGNLATLA